MIRAKIEAWFESRLPRTDTWVLGQRNIYILPTRAGITFAITMVVMLLASINYQLNLGYALTFALAGAGLVSMHLTHSNLRGLSLHLKVPGRGFAGEAVPLDIVLHNPGRARHGLGLRLQERGLTLTSSAADTRAVPLVWCDAPAGGQSQCQLRLVPPHRGWHAVPTVHVETVFPLGLFRAWTVWRPAARLLAWPAPERPAPALPTPTASTGEPMRPRRAESGEFDGVRPWRRGDSMRQVVWKKVARSGQLVSRETAGTGHLQLWLDWANAGVPGHEQRLSRLAAWLLSAEAAGLPFGLRLPGREREPGSGRAQRDAALDELAQWQA